MLQEKAYVSLFRCLEVDMISVWEDKKETFLIKPIDSKNNSEKEKKMR